MNWLRWPVLREVDPLLFSYFALLFATLFAVGDSFVLTIAPGWVLCGFLSAQFTSCYKSIYNTYGDQALVPAPEEAVWCLFCQLAAL